MLCYKVIYFIDLFFLYIYISMERPILPVPHLAMKVFVDYTTCVKLHNLDSFITNSYLRI